MDRISNGFLKERQNVFLLSLAVTYFGVVVTIGSLGETRIAVYVSALAAVYFMEALIFRVKNRTNIDFLGAALIVAFILSIFSSII